MQYKFKAFISYSHADAKWARWLHSSLERYRPPKSLVQDFPGKDLSTSPVFRDRDDLASASDLNSELQQALRDSENFILICSPASARSRWSQEELKVFLGLGRVHNIFCLIVDGEPSAAGRDDDCFPPLLRELRIGEGSQSRPYEPIAADARPTADGKTLALQKIIAGILGVSLDAVRRREIQRRQRFLVTVTLASLAGFLVTSALAVAALVARQEAERQRDVAELRSSQAEGLLSFMVGDLRSSLEPLGKLDLLDNVAQEAIAYFTSIDSALLSDGELARQSQVLVQIGEVSLARLDYDRALEFFKQAYLRSDIQVSRIAEDRDSLFSRGQSEFWIGYAHWEKGQLEDAEHWLKKYLETNELLLSRDPGNRELAIEVAYGHKNLSVLAVEKNDFPLAESGFTQFMTDLQQLLEAEYDTELMLELGDTVSWLGNLSLKDMQFEQAVDYYRRSADILRKLVETSPGDFQLRYELALKLDLLASIEAVSGAAHEGRNHARESLAMLTSLGDHDLENAEWRLSRTLPLHTLALLDLAAGDHAMSEAHLAESGTVFEESNADQLNQNMSLAAVSQHLLQARLALARDEADLAGAELDLALARLDSAAQGRDTDEAVQEMYASMAVLAGEVHLLAGRQDRARLAWQKAIDIGLHQDAVYSYRLQDAAARAFLLSGDGQGAAGIVNRLTAGGYQHPLPWPELASAD